MFINDRGTRATRDGLWEYRSAGKCGPFSIAQRSQVSAPQKHSQLQTKKPTRNSIETQEKSRDLNGKINEILTRR